MKDLNELIYRLEYFVDACKQASLSLHDLEIGFIMAQIKFNFHIRHMLWKRMGIMDEEGNLI